MQQINLELQERQRTLKLTYSLRWTWKLLIKSVMVFGFVLLPMHKPESTLCQVQSIKHLWFYRNCAKQLFITVTECNW